MRIRDADLWLLPHRKAAGSPPHRIRFAAFQQKPVDAIFHVAEISIDSKPKRTTVSTNADDATNWLADVCIQRYACHNGVRHVTL
jgi:hypothetical protein